MAGAAVKAVLDLDSVAPGDPRLDLSYSLVFFQAVLRERPPTSGQASSFLAGYESVHGKSDRDVLPKYLLTALLRGLTLWSVIRYLHPGAAPRARLDAWIGDYLPLSDSPELIPG
jgi:aminoglycoside phosphotransferase (APT) family kinase protein